MRHGQKRLAARPLAPRPRPSYDHASCMETSDFAWLNGRKFRRAGCRGVAGALECGAYSFRRQTPRPRAT